MSITFEWDSDKAKSNWHKHQVTFEEASSVFLDDFARLLPDPDHSVYERLFLVLGISHLHRLLVVCHCDRKYGTVVLRGRIISALNATGPWPCRT